ncbi:MAG: KUP/HAK/KT family potassium transporter [Flavobacteriales bacterium]|nr:KUP/HAK/KT family potassium transporter [Flavobacteriales bacterium]
MSTATANRLSAAGLLVTLGIVYGDIGTSPLYVMSAIIGDKAITQDLVYGGISCIFWTLTSQTTFKYILLTLRADNKGEGGIFSLYALVQRRGKWLFWPAMIGAGTLMCDGMITPPISVSSAIEGLRVFNEDIPVIPIVIAILTMLFIFQRYGTKLVGKTFGPIMLLWFIMLGTLGVVQIARHPEILSAINPIYAYNLLSEYPGGFWLLGAVFLCTTGADALYSDLGHAGRSNIQVSWIFVKISLVLNYMGQGAWLMSQDHLDGRNPFYNIMPDWFLVPGIIIAACAAVIASQALITGSFTLISEAINLNFWPKVATKYPTELKGQLYIPSVNWLLYAGCLGVVLFFGESKKMEAAYGFFITITMMMTTTLLTYYLEYKRHWPSWLVGIIFALFIIVEFSFFVANSQKLKEAWMMLLVYLVLIHVMWITYMYRKMSNYFLQFEDLDQYVGTLRELSDDKSVPKFATHLVFLTKANFNHQVEKKIMESILAKTPKRADIYWFVHVDRTNDPYAREYDVEELSNDLVIKVNIRLGFRVQPRVHNFFNFIVDEMVEKGEIDLKAKPEPYSKYNDEHDFKFVVLEKFLSADNELSVRDSFITNAYMALKHVSLSDIDAWGLEESDTVLEKVPLVVNPAQRVSLKRSERLA